MAALLNPPTESEYNDEATAHEYLQIAEKVRTGEYFREARDMYDLHVHDPMAERYLYVFITIVALIINLFALAAAQGLYPLNTEVPLIVSTNDPYEDLPRIRSLISSPEDDPNEALLRFVISHYITIRENYDIATFDRNVNGVRSQSTEAVYRDYQQFIDPRNPESPIAVYQRHSRRRVGVLSYRRLTDSMEVIFEAVVDSGSEVKKSLWRANIAFQYTGVALDEKTDKVTPMSFVVTDYRLKRLQDMQ